MIQINSFIPTDNFTRRVWEFHEDKIVNKTKSLTIDAENEVEYKKIKFIRTQKTADLTWLWWTFITFAILSVTTLGLGFFDLMNPTLRITERVIAAVALLLALPAFRKHEFYYFLDAEKYRLATIKIDSDDKKALIAEAISLIKSKTEIIVEVYIDGPLPDASPIFEIVEFDLPDFLNKSTTRFYEDKIIETSNDLVEETVRVTKYEELNGTTKTVRMGNDNWGYVFSCWLIFVCVASLSASIFFPNLVRGNSFYVKIVFSAFALLIPLLLLRYIKSDFLVFTDKNDDGILGLSVNKKNREKIDQIIQFVKHKVESQNQKPA